MYRQRKNCGNQKMECCCSAKVPSAATDVQRVKLNLRRRSRYEKPMNALWELFSEYSDGCSIHGIRYLGEKKRHWFERIWWLIVIIASFTLCCLLIFDAYAKWQQLPVIVTFAEKSTPIWRIPFPAVTICPETKCRQSVLNYTYYYGLLSENGSAVVSPEHSNLLTAASRICRLKHKNIMALSKNDLTSTEIYKKLKMLAPGLNSVIYNCDFNRKKCSELFHDIWTDDGLCFSFNMLNANELYNLNNITDYFPIYNKNHSKIKTTWTTDRGYDKKISPNESYPYRVFSASEGITINLRLYENDFDYICGGSVQSYKLLLHAPGELPQMTKYFYRIPLDTEVVVAVKPHIMTVTDKIRNYDTDKRQCVLSERKLTYFKEYTQRNCELECIIKHTIRSCGCAAFYMPRPNGTKICGLKRSNCYTAVYIRLSKRESSGQKKICNCYPACSSISYDAELSSAIFDLRRTNIALRKNVTQRKHYTRIFISFKENQFFASKRSELYGTTDFLGNCGGLLGLFMGVSFLSIVEIFYYCTLRLGCNLNKRLTRKRKLRALRQQQIENDQSSNNEQSPLPIELILEPKY